MLPEASFNTDGIQLARPGATKAGGDRVMRVLHRDVRGRVVNEERFVRAEGSTGVQRLLATVISINPVHADGTVRDVQSGDVVSFPDYRGIIQEREIGAVTPMWLATGALSHLRIEIEELI